MTATRQDHRPAGWLRQLAGASPSRWLWGPALRSAICIAGPLAVGMATGHFLDSLWISLATVTMAAGEGAGTYRSRFRQMAIATPIAACGYLAGYLAVLPYPAVIAAMTAIAFLAGIVNSYGAALSIGTMQFLLLAALGIGLPGIAPFWQPALLYVAGVGLYAFVLWLETLIDRRRPERSMLAALVAALGRLATARAADPEGPAEAHPAREAARRAVTDHYLAFQAALIDTRRSGRTRETTTHAEILDAAQAAFEGLIAETDPAGLSAAAAWLGRLSRSVRERAPVPAPPAGLAASQGLGRLSRAIAAGAFVVRDGAEAEAESRWSLARLCVGRAVMRQAAALALCTGVAYAMKYVVHASHWYWIPLTVALVLKPDLGSVFVRAVLRAVGALIGVAIGAAALILLPKGYLLVSGVALLAALLPWAKRISYGAQAVALTPLILILIDLVEPGLRNIDYGGQRLADTILGGAIVLVFGYFIWPRSHASQLQADFAASLDATAAYLETACAAPGEDAGRRVGDAGRTAYAQLSDLRATLDRSMAEPPPAGREAAAWFPLAAGAERICDRITAYAGGRYGPGWQPPPAQETLEAAALIRSVAAGGGAGPPSAAKSGNAFLDAVEADASRLARRLEAIVPPGARHVAIVSA